MAREDGFTILEVIVAFAILSIFSAIFFPLMAIVFRSSGMASSMDGIISFGRAKLEVAGVENVLSETLQSGTIDGGGTWTLLVRAIAGDRASHSKVLRYQLTFEGFDSGGRSVCRLETIKLAQRKKD